MAKDIQVHDIRIAPLIPPEDGGPRYGESIPLGETSHAFISHPGGGRVILSVEFRVWADSIPDEFSRVYPPREGETFEEYESRITEIINGQRWGLTGTSADGQQLLAFDCKASVEALSARSRRLGAMSAVFMAVPSRETREILRVSLEPRKPDPFAGMNGTAGPDPW
jgi:hypothetical protein